MPFSIRPHRRFPVQCFVKCHIAHSPMSAYPAARNQEVGMLVRAFELSRSVLWLPMILLIAGCVSTTNVSKLGKDTYTINAYRAPLLGGTTAARGIAVDEAGAFCAKMEKEVLVKNISLSPYMDADNVAVIFQCLSANDPEYTRPTFRPAPDTVIEDRRR